MTLIAYTENHGSPILLGDLLVSGDEEEGKVVVFPSHHDGISEIFPVGSGFVPLRLTQKIYLVNTNLAIGIAGELIYAKHFLKDFNDNFTDIGKSDF